MKTYMLRSSLVSAIQGFIIYDFIRWILFQPTGKSWQETFKETRTFPALTSHPCRPSQWRLLFSHFLCCPPSPPCLSAVVIFSYSPRHAVTSVSVWHRPHQSVNNHDIARLQTTQQIMKILANLLALWATIGIKFVFFKDRKIIKISLRYILSLYYCMTSVPMFDVFFWKSNNLILRRNKFSKHEMLHQSGHVLEGVSAGDRVASQIKVWPQ